MTTSSPVCERPSSPLAMQTEVASSSTAEAVEPSTGSTAAAFAYLHRQHRDISACIEQLRVLMNASDAKEPLHLALLRLRACVGQHLASEDNLLYAVLRHHPHASLRSRMETCSQEVNAQAEYFAAFNRRWLGRGQIQEYPLGFWFELNGILDGLSHRIQYEEREIYPFIVKHLSL